MMAINPETKAFVIDQMDEGMDLLRVAYLAMCAPEIHKDEHSDYAILDVIGRAIGCLAPVREAVNKAHGEERI